MTQFYFDPKRAGDLHALPDGEVFYMDAIELTDANWRDDDGELFAPGWYYWACFPGCLPDSEPVGPFASEEAAVAAAQGRGLGRRGGRCMSDQSTQIRAWREESTGLVILSRDTIDDDGETGSSATIATYDPAEYIVINDGSVRYVVDRDDLREGDTEQSVRAMSVDEYAAWCRSVPADQRHVAIGEQPCIDLCAALVTAGAEYWYVG